MTYICKNCYEEFNTPDKTSSRMGIAWIIFIFLSMGIGFIFWLFMRGSAKEICPNCKNQNFVRTDSRAGAMLVKEFSDKKIPSNYVNKETQNEKEEKIKLYAIIGLIVFVWILWNVNK
jgi:hypothetical protein